MQLKLQENVTLYIDRNKPLQMYAGFYNMPNTTVGVEQEQSEHRARTKNTTPTSLAERTIIVL